MRVVDINLNDLSSQSIYLGYAGEKNHVRVIIHCPAFFRSYPDAVATMVARPPVGDLYPVILERVGKNLVWEASEADLAYAGSGDFQITFTQDGEVVKTAIGHYSVNSSLVATGEAPDPIEEWVEEANEILAEFGSIADLSASATTLEAGADATAEITTVDGHKNIAIGIPTGPKGEKGDDGDPAPAEAVADAVDDYLAENFSNPSNPPLDRSLTSSLSAAPADLAGNMKGAIEELAVNGYYEAQKQASGYLQLSSGLINSSGNVAANVNRGYIWLTSEQEKYTLTIDTQTYLYNLCYMNGDTVAKYTGWLDNGNITFDDTIHTKIGITVKKGSSGSTDITSELDEILHYEVSGIVVGNLATKDYVVPKQQDASESGKLLGINENGLVVPVEKTSDISVDDTLSVSGDAADAKVTGGRIAEIAENGYYIIPGELTNVSLTTGGINSSGNPASSTAKGYIWIMPEDEDKIYDLDPGVYKYNLCYMNGETVAKYTTWLTSTPIVFEDVEHTKIGITVTPLSGSGDITNVLNEILYYDTGDQYVGNLATKDYVANTASKKRKCIYPDDFISRIKPDIYYNGYYYADINTDDYKISGSKEVWLAVDGDNTSGDGSENKPFLTIGKAKEANAVTVHLKPGTYLQGTHFTSGTDLGGLNLIGHGTVIFQENENGGYIYATSSAYIENIVFQHGNPTLNDVFIASCTQSGQVICFVDCVFRDGGGEGLAVTGIDAVVVRCAAFGNKLDGFNYHKATSGGNTFVPNAIEIDCVAYNNGSNDNDSCNGSTIHDGERIVRINGEYYSTHGGVIADIGPVNGDTTISVNYGVLAHDSTGNGTYKASFWASTNTKMYLYDCESYGGTYDISAINDALVVSRRLTTGRDVPAVNRDNTANVIQY